VFLERRERGRVPRAVDLERVLAIGLRDPVVPDRTNAFGSAGGSVT
jgi:hypothetical protein